MDVYYVNSLIEELDLNPTLRFEVREDGLRDDIVVTVSNKEHLYQFSLAISMLDHYDSRAIKDVIQQEVDSFVASSIEEQTTTWNMGDFLPNWDWKSDRWSTPDKKTEEAPKVPVCECGSQYSSIKTHHYDWCPLFKKKSNK